MTPDLIAEVLSLAGERADVGIQLIVAASWARIATDRDGCGLYAPPGSRVGLPLDAAVESIVARARRERDGVAQAPPVAAVGWDADGRETP